MLASLLILSSFAGDWITQEKKHIILDCYPQDLERFKRGGGKGVKRGDEAGDFVAEDYFAIRVVGVGVEEVKHAGVASGQVFADEVGVELADGRMA